MTFASLFQNHLLINALTAWAAAQVLKVIIYALANRRLDLERLFGDGGMPSGHSATVTALAATAGMECGLNSAVFALSAILAVVVMHDARGVRRQAGKHAKAINELMAALNSDMTPEDKLQEFLGHTPLQVFFGALTGLIIAFVMK